MQNKKEKALIWVGVAAVILGIIIFVNWTPQGANLGASQPTGTMPSYAPPGQVVAGFPQELILGADASFTESYSVNYSSSTNQFTAQWDSSSTVDDLVSQYQKYFSANGWTAGMNQTASNSFQSISATNSNGASALVTIVPQSEGSQVSVTYLPQSQ